MDITVTIPNGKVDSVAAALADDRSFDLAGDATAAQIKTAVAAHYRDKWTGEVRDLLKQARRQERIRAAIAEADAFGDPLA